MPNHTRSKNRRHLLFHSRMVSSVRVNSLLGPMLSDCIYLHLYTYTHIHTYIIHELHIYIYIIHLYCHTYISHIYYIYTQIIYVCQLQIYWLINQSQSYSFSSNFMEIFHITSPTSGRHFCEECTDHILMYFSSAQ